ncbi:NADH dehydrogenase [ubiquinone] 1 alpha subcomplex subunit 11-like [Branchiostoma floridae]|uniref:NADH dehydrogenase [ubiquinone] 1 alpha subcomplex subunit 11 n=1 Tax=Branchiostoma floridae TaxID=7739 RepID=C3YCI2_BRAFL|nr:NADH dehydrogenase [ubiquinone] 1 alpha subcomplex subunit 11-like [Branchiostoma floridae]|eukprot:XP_002606009.1 hypothetical protein BRAFLDRAFT_129508 [Branchiostoma floridae]
MTWGVSWRTPFLNPYKGKLRKFYGNYWEKKDGEDVFGKTLVVTKISTSAGLVGLSYWLIMQSYKNKLTGPVEVLMRTASTTATFAGLGAIFGLTTQLLAQKRGDDEFNYAMGGCAAGTFIGVRMHSYSLAAQSCIYLGAAGFLYKVSKIENWRPQFTALNGPPMGVPENWPSKKPYDQEFYDTYYDDLWFDKSKYVFPEDKEKS